MESTKLPHPELDENQNLEVNAGASNEDQLLNETNAPITTDEVEILKNDTATAPENEEQQQVDELPEQDEDEVQVQEPTLEPEQEKEEEPKAEQEPQQEKQEKEEVQETEEQQDVEQEQEQEQESSSVMDEMVSEIEDSDKDEDMDEDDEDEQEEVETESIETIENEYNTLSIDDAVAELEKVVENENYPVIKSRVGILKAKLTREIKELKRERLNKFIEEGGDKEDYKEEPLELEERFYQALNTFKNNKNRFIENLERQKEKNLIAKQEIIEGLKTLIDENLTLKEKNDKFKEYQEAWRNIGPVPQNETNNLWKNYHFNVDKFYDLLRISREIRELDLKKNLEQKIQLCEKAESLLLEKSITKSFKMLQQLHNEWREIGPVMEDKKEEIWERFKTASDQINQNRRDYYDKLYTEQKNNYNAKLVLCEQAEELIAHEINSIKEHNRVSEQLTDLLKMWKTFGPAPSKLNDEIWTRFKTTLNTYFQQRKEYFQQIKETQTQNYNLKLNLTMQAEALVDRTDWRRATEEIIQLQKEWKNIGAVPRKNSDAIWKRFRSACDKFFENKSNYFANIKDIEKENLRKKEELIEKIANQEFTDDREANLELMKAFQRQWTEIGYVPMKVKDSLNQRYRETLNKRFADLKISLEEVKRSDFKKEIDTLLNDPNATKILDKERRFLTNKMTQLKDEINLLENNLGFFARSKNAELLREEFSKKIEAAKKEVEEIEYKIRVMDKSKK